MRDNVSVPDSFETTRKREERVALKAARDAERQQLARLKDAYLTFGEGRLAASRGLAYTGKLTLAASTCRHKPPGYFGARTPVRRS